MLTLDDIRRAADELAHGNGHTRPNLRIALWAAVLSARNDLQNNGLQVDNLRPYAFAGLPQDVPSVRHIIHQNGARPTTRAQARAIIAIDRLFRAGELDRYRTMPQSPREWLAWRAGVSRLGGLSHKTASFAALLLWPHECPFVPVDSHVCARLGHMDVYRAGKLSRKSRTGYRAYRAIEREVYAEWRHAGKPCGIALWHWYQWEAHRAPESVQPGLWADVAPEVGSHVMLSPYLYYAVPVNSAI